MKFIKFLFAGILFGIILTKSEVVSWYRIFEMFRFESFHMYGVIGSAVAIGALIHFLIKKFNINSIEGKPIMIEPKAKNYKAALFGGTIFGLGWAMTGACPGPMFIIVGNGVSVYLVIIASAVVGAFCYGAVRKYLPH